MCAHLHTDRARSLPLAQEGDISQPLGLLGTDAEGAAWRAPAGSKAKPPGALQAPGTAPAPLCSALPPVSPAALAITTKAIPDPSQTQYTQHSHVTRTQLNTNTTRNYDEMNMICNKTQPINLKISRETKQSYKIIKRFCKGNYESSTDLEMIRPEWISYQNLTVRGDGRDTVVRGITGTISV